MPTKVCPKCSKEMAVTRHVATLPSLNVGAGAATSTNSGLPVAAWVCDGCAFVELYYQKM